MRKGNVFVLLFLVGILLISSLDVVSAASIRDSLKPIVELIAGFIEAMGEALRPLLGDSGDSSGIFISKIFIAIIVFSVFYVSLKKINFITSEAKWAVWVIPAAMAILGVRFLTPDFVIASVLSNMAAAVGVTIILPFVGIYFLTKDWDSASARRTAWIVIGVVMFLLWIGLTTDPGRFGFSGISGFAGIGLLTYFLAGIIALCMAWFDGTLQGWRMKVKIEKMAKTYTSSGSLTILETLDRAKRHYESNPTGYTGGYFSSSSRGLTGAQAFVKDVEYLEQELRNLV